MTSIGVALEAAEMRKAAVFGEAPTTTLEGTDPSNFRARAVYSGFDIDTDELYEVSTRAADFFTKLAVGNLGLRTLFAACWSDAFLVGLLAANQPAPPTAQTGGDNDVPAGGG